MHILADLLSQNDWDNIQELVTGMGGLLFILIVMYGFYKLVKSGIDKD